MEKMAKFFLIILGISLGVGLVGVDTGMAQYKANVRDFGATGNGRSDDTRAIQKAIDFVKGKGGGEVFFPTGTYSVTRVNIDDGITYQGEANSVITRPANTPRGITTFSNRWNVYTGATDSKPLIIKNLIFDGNIENQGPYEHYELEHNNLLFLCGAKPEDSKGRLRAIIEDCVFRDSVSDGIAFHDNVYADIINCETDNCFRGGVVTGGSKLDLHFKNLTLRGDNTVGGFNIENTWDSSFSIDNMKLYGTDIQIGFSDSTLIGKNIYSDYNAFYWAKDSKIYISDSEFVSRSSQNNFFYPSDVTFENCKFSASEKGLPEADRQLRAAPKPIWGVGGNLAYKNCTFSADDSVDAADKVYGILTEFDAIGNNNRLTVDGGVFSKNLDVGLNMKAGGHWSIKNATFEAALPLSVYGYIRSTGVKNLFDVELDNLTIKSNKYLEIKGNAYVTDNTLTQRNMAMDESANYVSSVNGLEGNKYSGNRVIKGTKAPTASTSALLGDIYQLESDPSKKWRCVDAGYYRTDGSGNLRNIVASQWVSVE